MKRKPKPTYDEKNRIFLDGITWKFNTDEELILIIKHRAQKIIETCDHFSDGNTEVHNSILMECERILFLTKRLLIKNPK